MKQITEFDVLSSQAVKESTCVFGWTTSTSNYLYYYMKLYGTLFIFSLGLLSYNSFIDIMSKVMIQTTQWGKMKTALESYVGFDTIQEQIRKKSLKRGFELNIMVVGLLKSVMRMSHKVHLFPFLLLV